MRIIRNGRGFTLVELLVVIAIIGILVALLLPAIQAAREAARRSQCANNLKQLALGLANYEGTHRVFPPGEVHGGPWNAGYQSNNGGRPHCDWDGQIGCWMNLIFPFIEQQAAYDKLDFEIWPQYASAENREVMQMPFDTFLCPSDPYRGLTTSWGPGGSQNRCYIIHYYGVAGPDENSTLQQPGSSGSTYGHCNKHRGMFYNDSNVKIADVIDGTSNTAMLCEVWGRTTVDHAGSDSSRAMNLHAVVYFGYTPNSNRSSPWRANSFHPGGVQIAFADGTVHFVQDTIDLATWRAIATIRGGEDLAYFAR